MAIAINHIALQSKEFAAMLRTMHILHKNQTRHQAITSRNCTGANMKTTHASRTGTKTPYYEPSSAGPSSSSSYIFTLAAYSRMLLTT